jgi:hypothetical protein
VQQLCARALLAVAGGPGFTGTGVDGEAAFWL